ncbi:MAG: hypothetical protein JXB47_20050, partial [Anaerolineae bacterium]|nr:hypothetical protein [Anaerolineae bacterium]
MLQRLTIQRVTFIVLFACIFMMAARVPTDTDTWWHIRAGEYTVTHRAILTHDPFSHPMGGQPWINHSWGSQILIYLFYQIGGSAGLVIFTALLATVGMGFVYLMCEGNIYVRAFALVTGAAAAAVFWSPRPQMISFVLSTIVAYLLHQYRHGKGQNHRRLIWLIPPLMLLWANLHGGFAIGFILMFGYIAGGTASILLKLPDDTDAANWREIGQVGLAVVLSLAAICINPYGTVMLTYPFRTVGIGALQDYIQEWASPNFHERQTWPFVVLLFGALGFAGLSKRRLDWIDMALVSGTGFMALMAGRNIAVFAVVATPVLTRHLGAWLDARGWTVEPRRYVRGAMRYVNLALVVVLV